MAIRCSHIGNKPNLKGIYNMELKLEFISKIKEDDWTKENLEEEVLAWVKREKEGKNGDYLWPLRTALSGLKNSPSPFEIAWVIGKEESLKRIKNCL